MKADDFIHDGACIRFEQLVLAIARTRGGEQWRNYPYDVMGIDAAIHINARIREVGDTVPPWTELLPHFKANGKDNGALP